ncbi:MAG: BTAD domain-containing putative transcriptional regulator, partial [Actinomycetota bacterium]
MGLVACTFLGGAELLVDGARASVDTRKAIAVMAYLAVEGQASRDTLAALFWPESTESRARSALRRTLSTLRTGLDEGVLISDRSVVALSSDVRTDLADFHDVLAATEGHSHESHDVCIECLPHLAAAIDLYRGDFLSGFSLRDAPEFDDWTRPVTEGLRLEVARTLERLSIGRVSTGDHLGAVEAARRWIDIDPLHEPAHRNLMLLTAWAGDRPSSIEAYRRCVSVLATELGVPPLEETTELHEAILDDDLPPPPSVRQRVKPHPSTAVSADPSFIGRTEELSSLNNELMWSATGGRIIGMSGEAWMGKTRLLEEFIQRAENLGHRALSARAFRAQRKLPYGIVSQLLHAGEAKGWLDDADVPEWAVAEAARLVPQLARGESDAQAHNEARMYESITRVLLSMAGGRSLVLSIDDGQWMDDASASLLSYVAHRIAEAPAMVVVAARPGQGAGSTGWGAALDELDGARITLGPLDVDSLSGEVADRVEAERIIETTGGVPLLVAEHLSAGGDDTPSPAVQKYIEARVRSLDGLASQIAAAAAVLDGLCDVDLLRSTSGRSEEEVVDALDELMRDHVLRYSRQAGEIVFPLEAMQQTVYERLTQVRRRLLHGRAADAMASRTGARQDVRITALIADHKRMGGKQPEAAEWYGLAGDLAASVFAHAEARAAFDSALAMGHKDPTQINLGLGNALMMEGRYEPAIEAFQSGAASGDPHEAARAEHATGEAFRRLGRFDRAEHHFEIAEPSPPEPEALLADWALLEYRTGDSVAAANLAERAVQ